MTVLKKANSILRRFKRDESGMAAISWALSLTAIIGAMGSAMDFAMLSAADARSQSIADTTALAAAVYVKNFEQVPEDRTTGLIGDYTANELGYDYRNWVIDGAEGVDINVSYNDVDREATVTVSGKTRPVLMQILGFEELDFNAQTVVKYFERDIQDPASIVMVLDNSGSMAFDDLPINPVTGLSPPNATRRMEGLQGAAKNFMALLNDAVGPQPDDGSVDLALRTGMMAFDEGIVRTVPMDWGYIADNEFDNMVPLAATNSAPPLVDATAWLNNPENEPKEHEEQNPGKTPLKYLILMTDGRNTVGDEEWVAREGTQNWRRWVTGRPTDAGLTDVESNVVEVTPEDCRIEFQDQWDYVCNLSDTLGNNWQQSLGTIDFNRPPESGSWDYTLGRGRNRTRVTVTFNCASEVTTPIETEVCTPPEFETRYSGYEYFEGEVPFDNDPAWEEGELDITSNIETRAQCDILHETGVEVFTVGFALVPGQFETNEWADRSSNHFTPFPHDSQYSESVAIENANNARSLLQYCASSPQNFITAEDTTALEEAFDRIGNTIIKEIVRISS